MPHTLHWTQHRGHATHARTGSLWGGNRMPLRHVCLVAGALVCLLVGPMAALAQTWTRHRYVTDGFEVEFSGDVKVVPTQLSAETLKKIVRSTDYQQDAGEYVYIVGASLLLVDVNFENGVKQSFEALKCKLRTNDAVLSFPGGRAREVFGTDCHDGNYRVEARYYTKGKWFYQVVCLFKKNSGYDQGARRFVTSFKVIE